MQLILALAQVSVTTAAAWILGRCCVGSRWPSDSSALRFGISTSLGLAILSYLILAFAALHLISKQSLFLLTVVFSGVGLVGLVYILRTNPQGYFKALRRSSLGKGMVSLAFFLYVVWILLCVILPPSEKDEIIYHLEISKQILRTGGMFFSPDNIFAYFPQFGEMLFLFGLGTAGEAAAKLYHVLAGFLLALSLYGFSRHYLSKQNALLSCALFLSVPSVMLILPWAYVDITYALYAFLALVALLEYFKTNHLKWTILAGIMAGCASAIKYTGLQFLILLECLLLFEHRIKRRKEWPLTAVLLMISALPFIAPYLWRNWQATGWPLFPFKIGGFSLHSGLNWDSERARLLLRWLALYGAPLEKQTAWHYFLSPLAVFLTGRFNSFEFYDGVIGPLFLITPFLLARVSRPEPIKWLSLFSIFFLYYWTFTTRQVRFLIPLLPILSFLLAYGLAGMGHRFLYSVVSVFLAVNLAVGVREVWKKYPLPFWLGKESREQYLSRQVESYPIYRAASQMLGSHDKLYLINMRNYVYYLDCSWRSDFVFERYSLDHFMGAISQPDQLIVFFHSRGMTHLLVDEKFVASPEWGLEGKQLEMFQEFLRRDTIRILRLGNYSLYKMR